MVDSLILSPSAPSSPLYLRIGAPHAITMRTARDHGRCDRHMTTAFATAEDRSDFSMVLGGPLYQLFRRAHMVGSAMEMLARRVVVLTLIGWLPLLLLAVIAGRAWGGAQIPFLRDFDVHVR